MEIDIITKMDLFPFMNTFFTNADTFAKISDKVKGQHAFQLHRRLAINYPIEMQQVNTVHHPAIVNALQKSLCTGREPRWMFTKSTNPQKDFLESYSMEVKELYCKDMDMEYKSLVSMYELFPDDVKVSLNKIQTDLDQDFKKKKSRKR